jgi:hypothetical protein
MTGEKGDRIGIIVEMTGGKSCTFVDLLPSSSCFICQLEYIGYICKGL